MGVAWNASPGGGLVSSHEEGLQTPVNPEGVPPRMSSRAFHNPAAGVEESQEVPGAKAGTAAGGKDAPRGAGKGSSKAQQRRSTTPESGSGSESESGSESGSESESESGSGSESDSGSAAESTSRESGDEDDDEDQVEDQEEDAVEDKPAASHPKRADKGQKPRAGAIAIAPAAAAARLPPLPLPVGAKPKDAVALAAIKQPRDIGSSAASSNSSGHIKRPQSAPPGASGSRQLHRDGGKEARSSGLASQPPKGEPAKGGAAKAAELPPKPAAAAKDAAPLLPPRKKVKTEEQSTSAGTAGPQRTGAAGDAVPPRRSAPNSPTTGDVKQPAAAKTVAAAAAAAAVGALSDVDIFKLPAEIRRLAGIRLPAVPKKPGSAKEGPRADVSVQPATDRAATSTTGALGRDGSGPAQQPGSVVSPAIGKLKEEGGEGQKVAEPPAPKAAVSKGIQERGSAARSTRRSGAAAAEAPARQPGKKRGRVQDDDESSKDSSEEGDSDSAGGSDDESSGSQDALDASEAGSGASGEEGGSSDEEEADGGGDSAQRGAEGARKQAHAKDTTAKPAFQPRKDQPMAKPQRVRDYKAEKARRLARLAAADAADRRTSSRLGSRGTDNASGADVKAEVGKHREGSISREASEVAPVVVQAAATAAATDEAQPGTGGADAGASSPAPKPTQSHSISHSPSHGPQSAPGRMQAASKARSEAEEKEQAAQTSTREHDAAATAVPAPAKAVAAKPPAIPLELRRLQNSPGRGPLPVVHMSESRVLRERVSPAVGRAVALAAASADRAASVSAAAPAAGKSRPVRSSDDGSSASLAVAGGDVARASTSSGGVGRGTASRAAAGVLSGAASDKPAPMEVDPMEETARTEVHQDGKAAGPGSRAADPPCAGEAATSPSDAPHAHAHAQTGAASAPCPAHLPVRKRPPCLGVPNAAQAGATVPPRQLPAILPSRGGMCGGQQPSLPPAGSSAASPASEACPATVGAPALGPSGKSSPGSAAVLSLQAGESLPVPPVGRSSAAAPSEVLGVGSGLSCVPKKTCSGPPTRSAAAATAVAAAAAARLPVSLTDLPDAASVDGGGEGTSGRASTPDEVAASTRSHPSPQEGDEQEARPFPVVCAFQQSLAAAAQGGLQAKEAALGVVSGRVEGLAAAQPGAVQAELKPPQVDEQSSTSKQLPGQEQGQGVCLELRPQQQAAAGACVGGAQQEPLQGGVLLPPVQGTGRPASEVQVAGPQGPGTRTAAALPPLLRQVPGESTALGSSSGGSRRGSGGGGETAAGPFPEAHAANDTEALRAQARELEELGEVAAALAGLQRAEVHRPPPVAHGPPVGLPPIGGAVHVAAAEPVAAAVAAAVAVVERPRGRGGRGARDTRSPALMQSRSSQLAGFRWPQVGAFVALA